MKGVRGIVGMLQDRCKLLEMSTVDDALGRRVSRLE